MKPLVVADAGYESEENYSFLENHGIVAMIKPANYEISKRKKYQTDISRKENMMSEISTYAKEVADCTLAEIKIEKIVPAISEKKQYTVAMNVINVPINRNV